MRKIKWKPYEKDIELETGMLVKVDSEDIEGVFLVGLVNRLLGTCDDCTSFDKDDIKEYSDDYAEEFKELTHFTLKESEE